MMVDRDQWMVVCLLLFCMCSFTVVTILLYLLNIPEVRKWLHSVLYLSNCFGVFSFHIFVYLLLYRGDDYFLHKKSK